ncbi:hypothetical protein L9F63_004297, partial [Diploptera punctata]
MLLMKFVTATVLMWSFNIWDISSIQETTLHSLYFTPNIPNSQCVTFMFHRIILDSLGEEFALALNSRRQVLPEIVYLTIESIR